LKYFQEDFKLSNVHKVKNFADEILFTNLQKINNKYQCNKKNTNILFLSNLIEGKGYQELLEAFIKLPYNINSRCTLNFAGSFDNLLDENVFINKISAYNNIYYHGIVDGELKVKLLRP
jgi:glycosyltransferase involved in cell wall biosynthesis